MAHKINVNLIVGRFQPFTNGHLKCVEYAYEKKGVPTVLAMIETKEEKLDEKHPFPSSLLLPMYEKVFENSNLVEKIILVKNANIIDIGETLFQEGYNIVSWTCGTDRLASYTKMSSKYAEESHLDPNFEMLEVPRSDEDISATKVRKALLTDNEKIFNRLTPLGDLKSKLRGESNFEILKSQIELVMNK